MVTKYRKEGLAKSIERGKSNPKYVRYYTLERIANDFDKFERLDVPQIKHGSWQYWENPKMWSQFGWDGVWMREEIHHHNKDILNFAVADGRQVKLAYVRTNSDYEL